MSSEYEELIYMTGFDDCVLGVVRSFDGIEVVAYDYEKVIERNMADGMTQEEAVEYFEFNQYGAYVGPRTPVFIYPIPPEELPGHVD